MEQTKRKLKGGRFLVESMKVEDLFTPEDLNEEQKMIAETARQFIEREVAPYREEIENQDFEKIVQLLKKAGSLGLLAHSIPEAYGGLGLDKVSKGIVGEEIGGSSGYGVAHSNHTCIATLPITYFGNEEQKNKYLPKLASGDYLGAYCLTEPSSGSDALAAKTTAVLNQEKTHYILNGTKLYITNAVFSDTFIVYAKVNGDQFTAFILEKDFKGLSLGPEEQKMGIKGSSTRSVILEDCEVPVENVLGEVGKGHVIAFNVLNLGRFNLGSACMGAAKGALKLAIEHTNERKQFKKRISEFGITKEKVALMAARIFAAESLQYRTADLLEGALGEIDDTHSVGEVGKRMMEYALECAICKVYGSETLDYVVDESLQLHGGAGFIKEYPIEQMYRDSRINRIFEGTNEINRLLVPGLFLKKGAKGELPVQQAINQAIDHLKSGKQESYSGILSNERGVVDTLRTVYLALAGLSYQQFGKELESEQEILIKLADIGIELYASESAVLRAIKSENDLQVQLATTVLESSVSRVRTACDELVNGMTASKEVEGIRKLINQLFNEITFLDRVARNRSIASSVNESGRYIRLGS
ncbi:acyl-CoA dehydrogenase family protein [Alkalihalophilus marmarensis]|uniref:Acyl-CoA dehydrogenase n=1 Tax=Alkalihalophilus marmarensis DSM 21297 TaxID=1188261 RepID=U6SV00_9BACI|nr:acyl-CoA dehydrogenase family protein [Alkalihalophilus marmarensis]ERN54740.1 acyl-CoA dehydrogenase [Alkalihalophilus marmarensis DSM 21297]MCM3488639.1 acyl-CoA dehydrogenase family protein [Alkalihalophilus marmarensis]